MHSDVQQSGSHAVPGTFVYLPRPSDWGCPLSMRPQALRGHSETGPGSLMCGPKGSNAPSCSCLLISRQVYSQRQWHNWAVGCGAMTQEDSWPGDLHTQAPENNYLCPWKTHTQHGKTTSVKSHGLHLSPGPHPPLPSAWLAGVWGHQGVPLPPQKG